MFFINFLFAMKICSLRSLWLIALFATMPICAQKNSNPQRYAAFDNVFQSKNAAFNNGTIHFNRFQSVDGTFRYFKSSEFLIGSIVYDGQRYDNVWLKYDLLKDQLIIKLDGERNQMGFEIVKSKVESFDIGALTFKNLDLGEHPEFISGFFEETDAGQIVLYTKHTKDQFASLTNEKVVYRYVEKFAYVFFYENSFYRINSQRDLAKAFPEFDSEIAGFYSENAPLEQSDKNQFMKKLAFRLNQLTNNNAK